MILYPAIDLKDGRCVRLERGDMSRVSSFASAPADQASCFADLGFSWLHIVDLDGAISGASVNGEAVAAIRERVDSRIQLGGGIRDEAAASHWLERGVDRVIVGTAAVRDPDMTARLCERWPGRIAIALDHRGGRLATEGWLETTALRPETLIARFAAAGAAAFIVTDIARDGVFAGLDCAGAARLAQLTSVPTIVSGGLASLDDIHRLIAPESRPLAGAVIGRALYEGRLDARQALEILRGGDEGDPSGASSSGTTPSEEASC